MCLSIKRTPFVSTNFMWTSRALPLHMTFNIFIILTHPLLRTSFVSDSGLWLKLFFQFMDDIIKCVCCLRSNWNMCVGVCVSHSDHCRFIEMPFHMCESDKRMETEDWHIFVCVVHFSDWLRSRYHSVKMWPLAAHTEHALTDTDYFRPLQIIESFMLEHSCGRYAAQMNNENDNNSQ